LETLRQIVLECSLTEEIKWGVPCYTFSKKNVVMVSAFKDYACLSFFKGSLLADKDNILDKPGENSQAVRMIKFTNPEQIIKNKKIINAYILQAIELEKSGRKVEFTKNPKKTPDELLQKFEEYPDLKNAFYSLTPGRQRGYIIYFSQSNQSATRLNRIEKCKQKILKGEGLNDKPYSR
jgi:uncharacterized protein YdeI (YjbR/CyaY-like superfamily)